MRVRWDSKKCYGCRACELACSLRRQKAFAPGGGAITVRKDNRTGEVRWYIDGSCDACSGENRAWCARYCSYEALTELGEKK